MGARELANPQTAKKLAHAWGLIVLLVCALLVITRGWPVLVKVVDSGLKTAESLPFSLERQLRRSYGAFYDLVATGTGAIPKAVDPRIRSGARMIVGEAQQVRQKFRHHGSVPSDSLYLILCHGISGYTIKPDFINAPYPIHNQSRRTSELPVPANTPVTFPFTTGIDVDTLEAATVAVRAPMGTQCQLQLLDTRPSPPALMAETSATVASNAATTAVFPAPVQLKYSHGATPYLLRFTFSNNVRLSVSGATRPDQRVIIGETVHKDVELTGSVVGRLVDTRAYTLMQTPVHNGFIYGKTTVLQKLGITPPYTSADIAVVGSYSLQEAEAAE